ncbi:hypothetical protein Acsp05_43800 [Actinokineospora sp. NBRC 105648]|nr:hypothetical protein Acsp05_43800 [Actinokineospora sp. NBRC 105648]
MLRTSGRGILLRTSGVSILSRTSGRGILLPPSGGGMLSRTSGVGVRLEVGCALIIHCGLSGA